LRHISRADTLNVLFAGTPAFAARILQALIGSRHDVQAVLTQPDRPAGRGLAATASDVKLLALQHGIAVMQPVSVHDAPAQSRLRALAPDVMVVAAYGLLLPQAVLDIARHGAINIHASLLPRWRGAAPIQRALLAGDPQTGVSVMQMDAGLDTGPVLMQESIPILDEDTAGTLHDRMAVLGADMCLRALDALDTGLLAPMAQAHEHATYAAKIDKTEAHIDWRETANAVCRRIRAFNPFPGASASIQDVELKFWRCAVTEGRGAPGEVLSASENGLLVACGRDAVLVTELQRAGGRRLGFAEFLRGFPVSVGKRFADTSA
jgi:methionyl-tRNA formyltransferase